MIVSLAEPIDAIIRAAVHIGKVLAYFVHIGSAKLLLHLILALIRGVADDGVYFGPLGKERIIADDVGVQIVEWQRLVAMQRQLDLVAFQDLNGLIKRQLLGQHQRDLGKFYSEGITVNAIELARANQGDGLCLFAKVLFADGLLKLGKERYLNTHEFTVGQIQEVTAATRGVQDFEIHQLTAQYEQFFHCRCFCDSLAPGPRNGGRDNAQDVGFGCEMSAIGMALGSIHALLEDCPEDCGIDFRPVLCGGAIRAADQFQLRRL